MPYKTYMDKKTGKETEEFINAVGVPVNTAIYTPTGFMDAYDKDKTLELMFLAKGDPAYSAQIGQLTNQLMANPITKYNTSGGPINVMAMAQDAYRAKNTPPPKPPSRANFGDTMVTQRRAGQELMAINERDRQGKLSFAKQQMEQALQEDAENQRLSSLRVKGWIQDRLKQGKTLRSALRELKLENYPEYMDELFKEDIELRQQWEQERELTLSKNSKRTEENIKRIIMDLIAVGVPREEAYRKAGVPDSENPYLGEMAETLRASVARENEYRMANQGGY